MKISRFEDFETNEELRINEDWEEVDRSSDITDEEYLNFLNEKGVKSPRSFQEELYERLRYKIIKE